MWFVWLNTDRNTCFDLDVTPFLTFIVLNASIGTIVWWKRCRCSKQHSTWPNTGRNTCVLTFLVPIVSIRSIAYKNGVDAPSKLSTCLNNGRITCFHPSEPTLITLLVLIVWSFCSSMAISASMGQRYLKVTIHTDWPGRFATFLGLDNYMLKSVSMSPGGDAYGRTVKTLALT